MRNKLKLERCGSTYTRSVLCEEGPPEQMSTIQNDAFSRHRLQLPKLGYSSIHFPYVVCPLGHWTHTFLACDMRSACWQRGSFRQSSGRDVRRNVPSFCRSTLSALFTCRTGVNHVPYSLVCDHSRDCPDSSDEDFCVHPSCSGSWQFECTNKQVKHT